MVTEVKLVVLFFTFLGLTHGSSYSKGPYPSRGRLYKDILTTYNKDLIPDGPYGGPINVFHGLFMQSLDSLVNSVLTFHVWEVMSWNDNRLTWKPEDYNNVTRLQIPSKLLWKPDVLLLNSAQQYQLHEFGDLNANVDFDGNVSFVPPEIRKSVCQFNVKTLKEGNNIITCGLGFMSWTYNSDSLNIYPIYDTIRFNQYFVPNLDWDVLNTTVSRLELQFHCCPNEMYPMIQYQIHLTPK